MKTASGYRSVIGSPRPNEDAELITEGKPIQRVLLGKINPAVAASALRYSATVPPFLILGGNNMYAHS